MNTPNNTGSFSAEEFLISEAEKNRMVDTFCRMLCQERNPDDLCAAFSHEGQVVYFFFPRQVLEAILNTEHTAFVAVEIGIQRSGQEETEKAAIVLYGLDSRGERCTGFYDRSLRCPPHCDNPR
jgi:hypothetical protein